MSIKLQYFDLNGIAEPIRYILHYAGEEFEDVRYDRKSWPVKEVKDSLPFGQLPTYEEDGRSLTQSLAIARYVGAKAGLVPEDLWEQALLDAAVQNFSDFRQKFSANKGDLTKRDETVEFYFSRFEKQLKDNNGFFGDKLSWVDFLFVGTIEVTNLFSGIEIEKDYSTVQALLQKIRELPGVKEYIANRKPYAL